MTSGFVGFDFDHTLGIDNHLERIAFGVIARELGAPIDIEAPEENALIERCLTPFRDGAISMSAMLETFANSLPLPALPHSPQHLAEHYRDICYSLIDERVVAIDGARACIEELIANGVRVGILTNGWSPLQERKIAHALGTFPGPVLVSDTIGVYKPAPEAFAKLERALACPPGGGWWYVGDNPKTDIIGAHAYGLRSVWLKENGVTFPADVPPPDAMIGTLAELPGLIRGS